MTRKTIPLLILLFAACGLHKAKPETGVVKLEVGLDYPSSGVQPVARKEFFLLDADITELMPAMMGIGDLTAFVSDGTLKGKDGGPSPSNARKKAEDRAILTKVIQEHTVAKSTTDLGGRITFPPTRPGTYYILGWSTTREKGEVIIWNYRVDVKPGAQNISLSSLDAAEVTYIL